MNDGKAPEPPESQTVMIPQEHLGMLVSNNQLLHRLLCALDDIRRRENQSVYEVAGYDIPADVRYPYTRSGRWWRPDTLTTNAGTATFIPIDIWQNPLAMRATIWNKAAAPLYFEVSDSHACRPASPGSPVIPPAVGTTPGFWSADVLCRSMSLYTAAATSVNDSTPANIAIVVEF